MNIKCNSDTTLQDSGCIFGNNSQYDIIIPTGNSKCYLCGKMVDNENPHICKEKLVKTSSK